jgi:hypothetical protein
MEKDKQIKRFALTPELKCPELQGYKLPEIESGLEKARRILSDGIKTNMSLSSAIAELDKLIREERPPIAIEVEMEYFYMSSELFYGGNADWVKCDKAQFDSIKETITNSIVKSVPATTQDGTVKGVWVYE